MSNSPQTSLTQDDPLTDFDAREIELLGQTKRVYVAGAGPAVIVMHEMPGISPHVARFARWVREAGFTVFMPSLFGRDGAVPQAEEGAQIFQRVCVSREFRVLAGGGTSPVVAWLKALARRAQAECGGPGVGAVGMCFTGNFAISMMMEPAMVAAVACQPSLPLDDPAAIELSEDDAATVADRLSRDDLTVRAYRFDGDRFCRAARFEAYQARFGRHFDGRVLPDQAANPETSPFFAEHIKSPHSVVTQHLINRDGEATIAARDEILAYLQAALLDAKRPSLSR
ncbi:dienelactone hydrolase family protein [Pseudodonghicola sp.]|uniref:dienelactone hydrolase family protein n=1 Tax=Pseudodonghicola sp. TaxID=1969463 RepID=UPI003A97F93B